MQCIPIYVRNLATHTMIMGRNSLLGANAIRMRVFITLPAKTQLRMRVLNLSKTCQISEVNLSPGIQ